MTKEQTFWQWFKTNEIKYFYLDQVDDEKKEEFLNELLTQLHIFCDQLYFEAGGRINEKQDLIITANGNPIFFNEVELLVQAAPNLTYWNIIAFKQPIGLSEVSSDGLCIRTESMWFSPLQNPKSKQIGLEIYFEKYLPEFQSIYLFATHLILDNLLGEKKKALSIGHVIINETSALGKEEILISLVKLPKYIDWKMNKAAN